MVCEPKWDAKSDSLAMWQCKKDGFGCPKQNLSNFRQFDVIILKIFFETSSFAKLNGKKG